MNTYHASMNQRPSADTVDGAKDAGIFKEKAMDQVLKLEEAMSKRDKETLSRVVNESQKMFEEIINHYAGMIETEDTEGNEKTTKSIPLEHERPSMSAWMRRFAAGEVPVVREGIIAPHKGEAKNNTEGGGSGRNPKFK